MQKEPDFIKFIKKTFTDKNLASVLLISVLSALIVILVGLGLLWYFRAKVFAFVDKEYVAEAQKGTEGAAPADTQDSLVIAAVKKTNPAVVSIVISKEVPKYEEYDAPDSQDNPLGDLFPGFSFNVPQYQQDGTEQEDVGGGSGFLVSSDGLIVTNKHVVEDTTAKYTVFTNDGVKHIATVVARDPVLDIALIKIQGSNYPYLNLGDSGTLQVGQSVIAIGNALGEFRNTVSVGVVSGLARSITASDETGESSETLDHVIQTDAAINPGNSGGPLLDLSGNVIGVNVAVAEGSQSIGFALPIDSVKGAIESVETTGKIVRPYLGVRYEDITEAIKEANDLTVDYGALVVAGTNPDDLAVIPGSPADKAGIVENDIILDVDGVKLDDTTDLADIIREKQVGQTITLTILHRGVQETVKVTLAAAPAS